MRPRICDTATVKQVYIITQCWQDGVRVGLYTPAQVWGISVRIHIKCCIYGNNEACVM